MASSFPDSANFVPTTMLRDPGISSGSVGSPISGVAFVRNMIGCGIHNSGGDLWLLVNNLSRSNILS